MSTSRDALLSLRDVHNPWAFAVLPTTILAGPNDFLFRFTDDVAADMSATQWTLGFTLFRDRMGMNERQMPAVHISRVESIPVLEGPTHLVRLDVLPGIYLWVAHMWVRGIHAPLLEHAMPGCFLNCGSLAVRRADRSVRHA